MLLELEMLWHIDIKDETPPAPRNAPDEEDEDTACPAATPCSDGSLENQKGHFI